MIIELIILAIVLAVIVFILKGLLGFAIKFVYYAFIIFVILFQIGLFFNL